MTAGRRPRWRSGRPIPDETERGPSDDLALQFEAVSHITDEEKRIKTLLDGMIIKYRTKQMMGNLSS